MYFRGGEENDCSRSLGIQGRRLGMGVEIAKTVGKKWLPLAKDSKQQLEMEALTQREVYK